MSRSLLLVLLLVFVVSDGMSQVPDRVAPFDETGPDLSVRNLGGWTLHTASGGLGSDHTNALLADGPRMWVGTDAGVSVHEAGAWKSYTTADGIPGGPVLALARDSAGVIWIATAEGISGYDDEQWTTIPRDDIFTGTGSELGPATLGVDLLGDLWIGGPGMTRISQGGAVRFIPDSFDVPERRFLSITVGIGGAVWAGSQSGLARFNGLQWINQTTANSQLPFNVVNALARSTRGGVWIGTPAGLARFDGITWHNLLNSENSPIGDQNVKAVANHPSGAVWFVTNDGLYRYGEDGWAHFDMSNSDLPELALTAVAVDPAGNIWVATESSGLAVFDGSITVSAPDLPLATGSGVAVACRPNPVRGSADVTLMLGNRETIILRLVDVSGKGVAVLFEGVMERGLHSVPFDASLLAEGAYFLEITTERGGNTERIVVRR